MRLRLLVFPALALSFSLAEPCQPTKNTADTLPSNTLVFEVSTTYPRFVNSRRVLESQGKLTVSDRLTVKSELAGTIEKVNFQEGATVNVGDVLATFRSQDLLAEIGKKQAELKEAEATLELDQKSSAEIPDTTTTNREAVFLDEETPQAAVPDKTKEENRKFGGIQVPADWAAKIKLDEAKIERLNRELEELELRRQKLSVVASIPGFVHRRLVTDGSQVLTGEELFQIYNTQNMILSVPVPENLSFFIDRNQTVQVSDQSTPPQTFNGTIISIGPSADTTSRNQEIRIRIPNETAILKEGQTAVARVETTREENIMLLPARTLAPEGEQTYLYVVTGDRVQKIAVKTGQKFGNEEIEVIGNLRVDDPVVISGQNGLTAESRVRVVKEVAPSTAPAEPIAPVVPPSPPAPPIATPAAPATPPAATP